MNRQKLFPWLTLVSCCLFLGTSIGIVNNCVGVFYSSVCEELHFSLGSMSFYVTLQAISCAIFSLLIPTLIQRIKIQHIARFGVLLSILTYVMMSHFEHLTSFYIAGITMGIGLTCYQLMVMTCVLQNWFKTHVGLMTSLGMGSGGLFGAIFSPIISIVISQYGWRNAYLFCALVLALFLFLPCMFIRLTPYEYGLLPFGYESQTVIQKKTVGNKKIGMQFLVVYLILTAGFSAMNGFSSHTTKYGISLGYNLTTSATLMSVCMISNVTFKVFLGWLSDRIGPLKATFIMGSLSALGMACLILCNGSLPLLWMGCFLYGTSYATGNLTVSLVAQEFTEEKDYPSLYSKGVLCNAVLYASTTALYGMMFDWFGSYQTALVVLLTCNLIGLAATYWMYQHYAPKHFERKKATV